MKRRIFTEIDHFFKSIENQALLITGARQVGKTYIVREYAKDHFDYFIEINFLENIKAKEAFDSASNAEELLVRISAMTDIPMVKGKTLIFFDEVQECKEIVTAIKFLVEEGSYRYIMSGSLLGVELKDIRSVPVGYMKVIDMYPMDFFEFCAANRISEEVLDSLRKAFEEREEIDPFIHERMMKLFLLYLVVGGMPAVVSTYLGTKNIQNVVEIQRGIIALYKHDIAKYDAENKLYLDNIFDLIPSELNSKNKRFILKDLNENFKFSRYEHSFIWLKEAGVALPAYCAEEPTVPLLLSKSTNLFKLFLSDVGLLSSMYMNGIQLKILNGEIDINFGAVWENAIAQELIAHGFDLYYFNSKKQGELDFLIEQNGRILPIEVKSGKNYTRHHALSNVLNNEHYSIPEGIVFSNDNIWEKDKVFYCPIYLAGLLKQEEDLNYHYEIDLTGLIH